LLTNDQVQALREHLEFLYPNEQAEQAFKGVMDSLQAFTREYASFGLVSSQNRVDERDVILITYGDQVQEPDKAPLQSLDELLMTCAGDVLNGVHILPFCPYTSDDGFSVVDYLEIDPALGDWEHIEQIAAHFRLMADAVINHISASSEWFQGFLAGQEDYVNFFITLDAKIDLSMVVRPRTHPLLTAVETKQGTQHVWTTFSADQIDLNYAEPALLLAMTDVLLTYVAYGAQLIRLDAIAYMWKEIGTSCIHLPQTHRVVQFWRTVLDMVAPGTLLITETNVPHAENVSYFGDGYNEAQMVYQFSLPPLTLHAFHSGDARHLQRWAASLTLPSEQTTFFNFLASHDGIGVRPVEDILSPQEMQSLVDLATQHGGHVSYKTNADGSKSPYELNINYFDALNDPASDEPQGLQVERFLASQAILLSMRGVPGIYVHSFFGSRGWRDGVKQTGHYRTINRQKFQRAELDAELNDPNSLRHQVFTRYCKLIQVRSNEPAFHPQGAQEVLPAPPALFSFMRTAPDGASRVLSVYNVSNSTQRFTADLSPFDIPATVALTDLLSGQRIEVQAKQTITLTVPPYGVLWLRYASNSL
jgi:sucrose phosphorylase